MESNRYMESNKENSLNVEYNSDINELIIHYVRRHSELWNFRNKQYRNNIKKKKLWYELAQELNVTEEFVRNRWRSLQDRYIEEKKKPTTKSGQAALHFSPWPLMAHLSFLSDVVEPRKTVTNCQSFGIECSLSTDAISSSPLVTFGTEEYVHNAHDIQGEFQMGNMWNTRQTKQTEFCSSRPLDIHSRSNSASPHPNSASPHSYNASPSLDSASPRPFSVLPRPPRPPSRTPSVSPHSESHSQQNQTQPAKRAKKQLSETCTDAVDKAILNLIENQTSIDIMNSDNLFYLSISRDSQHLNVNAKLRLKMLVLQALSQVVAEEQNKT